jgi:pectinesterase
MPQHTLGALVAALALVAAPRALRAQAGAGFTVRAENTLGIQRVDETVGVPWTTVKQTMPAATTDRLHVREAGTGRDVVSQVVDNDGDGTPDELIFQANFFPGESRTFAVEAGAPATVAPEKARVYVSHQLPRDDMAWESDRIAFRMYGQGLYKVDSLDSSGLDVWVKRVRTPIVEKFYAKGHDSYHRDTGEGADFYDVGPTLGVGGTAVWKADSMYHAHNFKSQRIIANGPVRAVFEVQYEPWNAGGTMVSETKRIALDAGANLNRETSIFRSADGSDVTYVTGVNKRKGIVGSFSKANAWAWLTGWGPLLPKDGGHGDLGTAVLVPRDRVLDWKENGNHYFVVLTAKSGQPVVEYFGAGWTDSGDYRDVRDWWSYLDASAQRLATPVKVTVTKGTPTASAR